MSGTGSDGSVILAVDLRRAYAMGSRWGRRKETVAVKGISLDVAPGEVFGLLGPNGAGKTTAVRMLATLLVPTSGWAAVLGHDLLTEPRQIRRRIGLILGGERGLYGRLTALQNLLYFAALNYLEPSHARRRGIELLELVGLGDHRDTLVDQYSRGMRQRLHIARGLMADPDLLFMDEPTIGLDPVGADEVRQLIPLLVAQGKTILLTTHYMLEADRLCDRIAILNHGQIIARGTPEEIKSNFSRVGIVELTLSRTRADIVDDLLSIDGVLRVDRTGDGPTERLVVQVESGRDLRAAVLRVVRDDKTVQAVMTREPTLEEAYLSILQ